jgi:hypothetical protein
VQPTRPIYDQRVDAYVAERLVVGDDDAVCR